MQTSQINSDSKRQILIGTLICAVGAFFYCYEFVLRIIPGILQNELMSAFGNISATTFGQLSAMYYFAYSPMQLPVGMLMDRYGPRRLLTFACLCCTLGSWMFMDTSSMFVAGSGRFLVGFGSSFAFVGALSLAINWLPKKYFSLVAGLITTLSMFGLIYGEVNITAIAVTVGWMRALYLTVFVGGILSLIFLLVVRDGPKGHVAHKNPLPEFFRSVGAVLVSPQIWLIGIVGACLYTCMSVFGELWGKTYLMNAHHLTDMQAAASISAMFLGFGIGAPVAGYLSDTTGRRVLPLVVGAVMALICISIVLYFPGLSYRTLNILLFFYGVFSGAEIIVFIMGKENSGAALSGTVFAAVNMIVSFVGAIFQPLVGKLLDTFGDATATGAKVHVYTILDYQVALSVLPISLLIVTILAFFMKDARTLNH